MKYFIALIIIALAIFGFSYLNKEDVTDETAVIEGSDLTIEETATTTDETMTASAILSGTTTTSIEATVDAKASIKQ